MLCLSVVRPGRPYFQKLELLKFLYVKIKYYKNVKYV
jgi:hypothetical protein